MRTIRDLTPTQQRAIRKLERIMEEFFCNDDSRTDSMVYALDNGFTLHAIECFSGTGATDKRFDRIHSYLHRSVGSETLRTIELGEIKQLLAYATISVCPKCNNHAFSDDEVKACPNCLSQMTVMDKE
jgi:rubrerythrin